jgi:hypothetical protein
MEKIGVSSEKKYTFHGHFDIKDTYNNILSYLENTLNYWDVTVKDYEETNIGGKRKIVSKIEAEKIYNDHFKIIIKFTIDMSGKDTEVKINNKTKKLCNGTAKIILNSYIEPNWQGDREEGLLKKFIGQIYDKFVGNDELEKCMDMAGSDVGKLVAKFSEYMNATIK